MKIVIFVLFILSIHSVLIPSKIVIALNCGTSHTTVSDSEKLFKYQPDNKYVSGQSIQVDYHGQTEKTQAEIKYTFDKEIYMFQRHTYSKMSYALPVQKGLHTLIFKFAEMYFYTAGKRIFTIKLGDTTIIDNLDVVEKSGGKLAAHEQFVEIDVKVDGVYYKDKRVERGMEHGQIKINFVKGKADNPIIQAIIVYNSPIKESSQGDFLNLKKKWDQQKQLVKAKKQEANIKELIMIQNKKEKIYIRNDQLIVEEEQEQFGSNLGGQINKFGILRTFLMGHIGIIIWIILFGYGLQFTLSKFFKLQLKLK